MRGHDDTQAHGTADADGGSAANGQRANRVAELVQRAEIAFDEFVRQEALVDYANGALFGSPLDRFDGHEKKNSECRMQNSEFRSNF